ncbi:protein-disulfide reductase DsbD family protein [Aurantiacibacter rhizosphaerae]|uniref:Thiol:disulfide interchange protein n=1 Tax=Aurantiacibacter rhizosphaerae TaxID=2691582 RepID=A0A844XFP8_9SPHN|nr:protein-disulfide reductase DsbD domain-containing protein [Aurantiacibacter rhizosphaerae]MWV28573.1 thiol:disulfide interchange protein [Aurantiacibacter rhizosphaerae]
MQASTLNLFRYLFGVCVLLAAMMAAPASAQRENYIAADLVAESAPVPGETLTAALRFRPTEGWHGYWANPGDAGEGMRLEWHLPNGWEAGEPQYPVPQELELLGLINHVYKDPYAVLIPIEVPQQAAVANIAPITVDAQWLACSDRLCVPERATLTLRFPQTSADLAAQFDEHRAAIAPMIDASASFVITADKLRLAIPLPASLGLPDPHVFIEQKDVIDYSAVQTFTRDGDMLVAEIARGGLRAEPDALRGILAFGDGGDGVRFEASPGTVPTGGERIGPRTVDTPLAILLGGALLGGLLLNLMPCVFPILSLKALTLARAGGEERQARIEGLAYTAGVIIACLALGALMLALRSGGAQIGWAFQLQEPLVVAALLVLATLITANFSGLFEIPSLPIRTRGEGGAFATGLLAAVVATPCTGPFMAAALGAALLLPAAQALLLFAALGLGLALPFLLLGFVPALRRMLPKPGAWMETFRKTLAIPMGLTALGLVWLAWRLGGMSFAFAALALSILPVVALTARRNGNRTVAIIAVIAGLYFAASLPFRAQEQVASSESVLDPVTYSQEALAQARASGQPVFLWFTADWCLTCKVNEQVAIEREATRDAFAEAGVIAMRGDWTQADPEITRYLEEWQVAGVPLYVWYPAGGQGEQLPQVLTPDSLVELAQSGD